VHANGTPGLGGDLGRDGVLSDFRGAAHDIGRLDDAECWMCAMTARRSCTLWIGISRPERSWLHQLALGGWTTCSSIPGNICCGDFSRAIRPAYRVLSPGRRNQHDRPARSGASEPPWKARSAQPMTWCLAPAGDGTVWHGRETGAAWRAQEVDRTGILRRLRSKESTLQPCGGRT